MNLKTKNGAGFVKIPKELYSYLNLGDKLKVELLGFDQTVFYPIISNYKNYLGFYIPQYICTNNNLLSTVIKAKVEKLNGFASKIGDDGKIYIPYSEIEKMKLKINDLIILEGLINNAKIQKICEIHTRKKPDGRIEHFCIFSKQYKKENGVFNIKKKLEKHHSALIPNEFIKGFNYGILDKDRIVIFYTNKTPLIINADFLKINKLLYYLGCYFADGTKKGNYWAITASTFEQAKFYSSIHNQIILNSKSEGYISITSETPVDKNKLKKLWEGACSVSIKKIRDRIKSSNSLKINPYGSLVIREGTCSLLIFYKKMLEYIISKIIQEKNKQLALQFILGVLEGDGSPSANSRGHIVISTNVHDAKILEKILKVSGLDYRIQNYQTKIDIRINSLGILKNLDYLVNKIFLYYPKRRKKFIERFSKVGAVRFILGMQNYCSSWVKAWLKNEGILNKEYQLTRKGLKIKNALEEMIKDLSSNGEKYEHLQSIRH